MRNNPFFTTSSFGTEISSFLENLKKDGLIYVENQPENKKSPVFKFVLMLLLVCFFLSGCNQQKGVQDTSDAPSDPSSGEAGLLPASFKAEEHDLLSLIPEATDSVLVDIIAGDNIFVIADISMKDPKLSSEENIVYITDYYVFSLDSDGEAVSARKLRDLLPGDFSTFCYAGDQEGNLAVLTESYTDSGLAHIVYILGKTSLDVKSSVNLTNENMMICYSMTFDGEGNIYLLGIDPEAKSRLLVFDSKGTLLSNINDPRVNDVTKLVVWQDTVLCLVYDESGMSVRYHSIPLDRDEFGDFVDLGKMPGEWFDTTDSGVAYTATEQGLSATRIKEGNNLTYKWAGLEISYHQLSALKLCALPGGSLILAGTAFQGDTAAVRR